MRLLVPVCLVALGSALGGLSRWGVTLAFAHWFGRDFPWGTFFINLTGSLFLGWFATVLGNCSALQENGWLHATDLHLFVAVGFTGGYTTFSSFQYEGHTLLGNGNSLAGVIYLTASVLLGLLAVRLGIWLGTPA